MKYCALKIRNYRVLLCLLLVLLSFHVKSDDDLVFDPDGAFISTTGHATLSSYALEDHDVSFQDVLKLDASGLFEKGADMTNGIKGAVQSGGWIDLKAFVYDRDHNKQLVYHARLEEDSTEDYSVGTPQTEHIKIHKSDSAATHPVNGTDIKKLLQSANNAYHVTKNDMEDLERFSVAHRHLTGVESRQKRGFFGTTIGGALGMAVGYLAISAVVAVATGAGIAATIASGGTAAPVVTVAAVALLGVVGGYTGHFAEETYTNSGHITTDQTDVDYQVSVGEVSELGSTEKVDFDKLAEDRKVIPVGNYPVQVVLEIENASFNGAQIPSIPPLTPGLFKVWNTYSAFDLKTTFAETLWADDPGVLDEVDNEVASPDQEVHNSIPAEVGIIVNLIVNGTDSSSAYHEKLILSSDGNVLRSPSGRRPSFQMGDHITLEVNFPLSGDISFDRNNPDHYPKLEGFPFTWMAFFSGEVLYQCEPSIQPGEWRPWLGYDSQVHGTAMRKYPPNFNPKFNSWYLYSVTDDSVNFRWTGKFTRRMSGSNSVVTSPNYTWNKTKGSGSKIQRNNQKEGLNMELLRAWKDHTRATESTPDFAGFDGNRILPGLDPDEFLYFLNSTGETTDVITLSGEPWKRVPDDEADNPLNDIVTAYRKNRMWHVDNKDYRTVYGQDYAANNYEIQDIGTNGENPNGTGTGNKTAPASFVVHLPQNLMPADYTTSSITLDDLLVVAPLATDKGFYGNIKGPEQPTDWEKGLIYQISGLRKDESDNYAVSFIYEDSFGQRKYLNFFSSQAPPHIRNRIISHGEWYVTVPSLVGFGYYSANLWHSNITYTDAWTRIGGKELLDVSLRFLSVPGSLAGGADQGYPGIDLKESPGDGAYIYLNDFLDHKHEDFAKARHGRYAKTHARTYVFNKGDTTTFEVFDADPHTFVHRGTEWYLSERTQAKRLTDADLAAEVNYYVDSIKGNGLVVEDHTIDGTGKKFTYQWDDPGIYQLKVVYRGTSSVTHRIVVVDTANRQNGIKADISSRHLTSQEIEWAEEVGVSFNLGYSHWRLYTVENLDSYYRYREGPRVHDDVRQINRFHPGLDYADSYKWKMFEYSGGGNHYSYYADHPNIESLSTYKWPDHIMRAMRFDDGSGWLPDVFVRHTSEKNSDGNPMPDDIANSSVSVSRFSSLSSHQENRINSLFNDAPEPWQARLPWISFVMDPNPYGDTDVLSYRARTNIKVIYNMEAFFDNTNGAFSGNPVDPIGEVPDDVNRAQYLAERGVFLHLSDDETKLKREFFRNLATGRSIISQAVSESFGLSVRNAKAADTIIAQEGYPSHCRRNC